MYVNVIRSISRPDQIYVGLANDAKRRLEEAQSRPVSPYVKVQTLVDRNCRLVFSDSKKAVPFERWLKIRFWTPSNDTSKFCPS